MSPPTNVVVIIGAGGIGLVAARRLAGGRKVFIGSRSTKSLDAAKSELEHEGHSVETSQVDVADAQSVRTFAASAAAAGTLDVIVHTSGVSGGQGANVAQIFDVDLLGTAHVIDSFLEHVSPGTSVVCISSASAYLSFLLPPVTQELQQHFATAPTADLLKHQDLAVEHPGVAYYMSKQANNLRVQAYASAYGQKGARLNSVSPGFVHTKMGYSELQGGNGPIIEQMKQGSAMKRHATAEDVASVVAFLASREAALVAGTDVLVDGGAISGMRWSEQKFGELCSGPASGADEESSGV